MPNDIQSTLTFCREYVELAGDLASLGKVFLIAALVLGIAFGLVELIKKFQAPAVSVADSVAPSALKDLIDALKGFIEAISKAPAWIALFGIGLLLFWAAGSSIPTKCEADMDKPYASAGKKVGEASAATNSAANLAYEGDNRQGYNGDGRPDGK